MKKPQELKKLVYILNEKQIETIKIGVYPLLCWMKKEIKKTGNYKAGKIKIINT